MATLDHDERRRRIAEVVVDVIASEGLDAATVRRIAAAVGYSTTVVTHYFADKHDLLLSAYHIMSEIASGSIPKDYRRDPTDVVGYLISMSALDNADLAYWRTFIAIWDRSLRDPCVRGGAAFLDRRGLGTYSSVHQSAESSVRGARQDCQALVCVDLWHLRAAGIRSEELADRSSTHALTTEIESLIGKHNPSSRSGGSLR